MYIFVQQKCYVNVPLMVALFHSMVINCYANLTTDIKNRTISVSVFFFIFFVCCSLCSCCLVWGESDCVCVCVCVCVCFNVCAADNVFPVNLLFVEVSCRVSFEGRQRLRTDGEQETDRHTDTHTQSSSSVHQRSYYWSTYCLKR